MSGHQYLLAAFLSPALFYGGTAAVAAPILIHLLARRRFKRIRWAAIEFLVDAQRRNRRRIRLEEWILLALRCLAILCIALIVSRPFTAPSGLAAGLGGSRRTERVFVLDDSYSMAYSWQGRTSFDRAKEAVIRLIASIRTESPDDTVTLLRMSSMEEPVEAGTYLDETQMDSLLARIEALAPTRQTIHARGAIESLADALEQTAGIIEAAVYLISDFQRHDWVGREGASASTSGEVEFLDPLIPWMEKSRGLRAYLINVGAQDPANTALTELKVEAGPLVVGATTKVRATISNFSNEPTSAVLLESRHGGIGRLARARRAARSIDPIEPWQHLSVDWNVEFLREGFETLRVELPPDALPIDNTRYLAARVAGAVSVLVVNGEPSMDEYEDEPFFLKTALKPAGDVFSGNRVVVIDETQLEDAALHEFDVVVLANVYHISEPATAVLEQFVRGGGGLVVFLGDQVDADFYNAALFRDGEGLLPARLGERIHARPASHLVVADRLHPVMRQLSREGDPLGIGQVAFWEYYALQLASSKSAASSNSAATVRERPAGRAPGESEGPDEGAGRAGRVLARFDDANERPAFVEHSFGRGAVMMAATAVDKEWHHWPDHPTYLPVMTELIRSVARRGGGELSRWVGSRIDVPVDPAVFDPDVVVRTPAYPSAQEVGITALADDERGGLTAAWEQTDTPGFYEFILRRRDGGEVTRAVAVNVDPREADLSPADEAELLKAAGSVPCEYIAGLEELAAGTHEARRELWRVFLVAALVVLMGEQFLAWRWGRTRN